jgi:3-oxoacyl-[acyl-carrier protein] reductase
MNGDKEKQAQTAVGAKQPHDNLDRFHVGYCDSVSRTITVDDVAIFAKLSGDYNALHMDQEFAARTEFEQRVVHGFLHASLLSTLVGMKIPGQGALYLSQSFDFTNPVFIGDTVQATGTIEKVDRDTRVLTIATQISNQHGGIVLSGQARVKILRIMQAQDKPPTAGRQIFSEALLKNQTALVTGASRGIGRAIATALCEHGAHVYVNYLSSEQAAAELIRELEGRGGSASMVKADVSQPDEAARLVEEVAAGHGLDILINNAGPRIHSSPFAGLSWDKMGQAYEQIVGGAFHMTQAALPSLKASKGRIVNVLTSAALGRTAHNWLPYVSAKSALLAMSKNLAQELGPAGVRVNMVSPSMAVTDLTAEVPERIRQMIVSRTPLRRLATPEDVAGAVLFLVSPYADFVTGENLLVAGGDVML